MVTLVRKVADGLLGRIVPSFSAHASAMVYRRFCYCKRSSADNSIVRWEKTCTDDTGQSPESCSPCFETSRLC